MPTEVFLFGSFRLTPAERSLLNGDAPVRLGSRAIDILIALVEQAGRTVASRDLIARVWPDTVVDDASLRVNIVALRKALGDGRVGNRFIANVQGRGYAFVVPVTRTQSVPRSQQSAATRGGNDIPGPLTQIIGRDGEIAAVAMRFARRRLITIVGPGGVGKTTIAVAVAEHMRGSYADGVWFVALASLPNADLVPGTIGAVLGISIPAANPVSGLAQWLRDKQALLVLDNCEHVIDVVAPVVEELMRSAPRLHVLTTSRESLRAEGEWRYWLAPLDVPPTSADLSANDAMQYSAVRLFHERASAVMDGFVLGDADVKVVVDICRKMDGMPLALELVAAHLGVFGLNDLAAQLNDRLVLQIQGRRTALPRQRTLHAMLDWSFDLLSQKEQIILCRLSIFQGDFSMTAAGVVAGSAELSPEHVFSGLANLVDKSLVAVDIRREVTYYHLLELTRTYALDKLRSGNEYQRVAKLHAEFYRELLASCQVGKRQIGNVRAALNWVFSTEDDPQVVIALAAAATDYWISMSMFSECCLWGGRAMTCVGIRAGTRDEMMLHCGVGQALIRSRGMQPEARSAFARALAIAESIEDTYYQMRCLYGLWLFALRVVEFRECQALVSKYQHIQDTTCDDLVHAVGYWASGQTHYYLAEYTEAAAALESALAAYPVAARSEDTIRFGADLQTGVLCYQAVTFWTLGLIEQALQTAKRAVDEARRVNQPVSLCLALASPSSVLLLKMGYVDAAEQCIDELIYQSQTHALLPYHAFGMCSKGCLAAVRGDLTEAERLLRTGLQRMQDVSYSLFAPYFAGDLAVVLHRAGHPEEALTRIDAALYRAEQSESLWCLPELLRIKGEIIAGGAEGQVDAAEAWFVRARDMAHHQLALSWELRATISLAQFWHNHARQGEAMEVLREVYARLTNGFDTADPRKARELLQEWS